MRIVIVDGEEQVREELKKLLEKAGPALHQTEERDIS